MTALLLPVLVLFTIVVLRRTGRLSRRLFALLLAGTVASAVWILMEAGQEGRTQILSLPADAGGALHEPVPLLVETADGKEERVDIRIPEKEPSQAEILQLLEHEAAELDAHILGKNKRLSRIEWNLVLPTSLGEGQIAIFWASSRPEVLNGQGVIGSDANENGSEVELTAWLTCGQESLEVHRNLTVYPSREKGAMAERLQKEADSLNENREAEYLLPEHLDGTRLTWYRESEGIGQKLSLLLLLTAATAVLVRKRNEEERKKKRERELKTGYPELLAKTHLLLAAGLSLRRTLERLAADAARDQKRRGKTSVVGEELRRTWYDMENGTLEGDALMQFGERCALPEYKSFALLLAQNQSRGGHRLLPLLETEVREAFEDRKRQARIAGEKAAVRLALPMSMMLTVVLVLILVPALLSF